MSADEDHPERVEQIVSDDHAGRRLDVFLTEILPQYSRAHLRRAIGAGTVTVDQQQAKPAYRLRAGQRVHVIVPELPREGPEPEDVPLEVLWEDDDLIVINKPPGMVVHPAKGHWSGTLTAALAFHFDRLSSVGGPGRPGIVHRLDRDTSGVIVVAKTDQSHHALAQQFAERTVEKQYCAITSGSPDRDRDEITQPIGQHPYHREKMAIRVGHPTSRDAHTFYEVAERFDRFASLKVSPKTGRTHQIRVHLAHLGCPVLCDRLYGGRSQITRGEVRRSPSDDSILLDRPALHARRIRLIHPSQNEPVQYEAPLPQDIQNVLDELRKFRRV